jgi:hypothetical protein
VRPQARAVVERPQHGTRLRSNDQTGQCALADLARTVDGHDPRVSQRRTYLVKERGGV